MIKIKILKPDDFKIWKSFRLEALKNSPENFGSSYEEELNRSDLDFKNNLIKNDIFGAFVDNSLVACVGFYSLNTVKTKHRGVIWGMYTKPEYRRQSIASTLIQAVINHAKLHVAQLHLTCVTDNLNAIDFYKKQGFKIYGTEFRGLKIEDKFFDEYLMILDLQENNNDKNYISKPMSNIDRIKNIWATIYDPQKDTTSVIEKYFHPQYEQCINGVVLSRSEYINHVIMQKKNVIINHIDYIHHLENGEELFAIYQPKGKNTDGSDIEAEVISRFLFRDEQLIKVHGQVRLIKGNYSDVDMKEC